MMFREKCKTVKLRGWGMLVGGKGRGGGATGRRVHKGK